MVKKILSLLFGLAFWLPIAAFTALILQSSIPYFMAPSTDVFFLERPALARNPLWRSVFYLHILGGLLVLLSAFLQFSKVLLHRAPRFHRVQGRLYVWSALVVTAPTGLYLAFYAKGGAAGRIGFAVQGVLLFYTTWIGLKHILQGRLKNHVTWMVRSYSVATTAISFRLWYIGLWAVGFDSTYVAAIWLSTIFNLLLCELYLHLKKVNQPRLKGLPA